MLTTKPRPATSPLHREVAAWWQAFANACEDLVHYAEVAQRNPGMAEDCFRSRRRREADAQFALSRIDMHRD